MDPSLRQTSRSASPTQIESPLPPGNWQRCLEEGGLSYRGRYFFGNFATMVKFGSTTFATWAEPTWERT